MQALQAALADKATEYQDAMQEWDSMKEVTRDLNVRAVVFPSFL